MWIPIIIPLGLRNKSKLVDNKVRTCVNCKNNGVQLVKNDEWFHLFFIPLVKVNKGQEYLHCPTCGATWPYVPEEHYATFNNPNDVNFEPAKKKDKKRWGRKKHKYDGPSKQEQQQTQIPPEYYYQQQHQQQQQQQQYQNYNQPQMSQEHNYYQQPQFSSDEQQKYFNEKQPIGPPDKNYNK